MLQIIIASLIYTKTDFFILALMEPVAQGSQLVDSG